MPEDTGMPEAASQTSMSRVLLLNDDVTPMEFVVHVLESVFDMDRDAAMQLMLHIHRQGNGECGVYPAAVAYARAKLVQDLAHEHQHPLRCLVEPVPSS
jgi:ATP-dependent Clp protease adapter protein ClpS